MPQSVSTTNHEASCDDLHHYHGRVQHLLAQITFTLLGGLGGSCGLPSNACHEFFNSELHNNLLPAKKYIYRQVFGETFDRMTNIVVA